MASAPSHRVRQLAISGQTLNVPVRESPRAKKLRAVVGRVRSGEVEVVVPKRTSDHEVDRFIKASGPWILRTLREQQSRASLLGLARAGVVWRLGEAIEVVRAPVTSQDGLAKLASVGDRRVLAVAARSQDAARRAISAWCREEARLIAEVLCAREAGHLGVKPTRIRVADQTSRWGSASSSGTLSFNWRLLMAPLEVFDYVVVHELAHLVHMDHSSNFWSLVYKQRPEYRTSVAWLDRHGYELRDWRPDSALFRPALPASPC
jgi:predicted metal-dependent hydrolase